MKFDSIPEKNLNEKSHERLPKFPGIIVEGKHLEAEELTLDILIQAKEKKSISPERFNELLLAYTRELELDALTGLSSRRFLQPHYNKLKKEMNIEIEHRETPRPQGIMVFVLDMNNFKQINDTYGHATGDKTLQTAARRIKESFHEEDMAVRYGGDEMVVLAPIRHTGTLDYEEIFNKKRAKITGGLSAGISMGYYVVTKEDDIDIEEAIARADKAMYKAKHEPRA